MADTYRVVFSGGAEVHAVDRDGMLPRELQHGPLIECETTDGLPLRIVAHSVAYAVIVPTPPGARPSAG